MKSWLFQGNPDQFDMDQYLTDFDTITWSVRQQHCANRIAIGDEVFLWRAAGRNKVPAGVIAYGTVISEPAVLSDAQGEKYWREKPNHNDLRVKIKLLARLLGSKQLIKKEWLETDPVFHTHRIFRLRTETNYALTSDEARRLRALCSRTGIAWTREEAIAGLWVYKELLGKSISRMPESLVAEVALVLGRSVGGVYNKVMNFRAIDPTDERKGLPASSETDRAVWAEFFDPISNELVAKRLDEEFNRLWCAELMETADTEASYQEEAPPPKKDLGKLRNKPPAKVKQKKIRAVIRNAPPRNPDVGELALERAAYSCEVDPSHSTFVRSDGNQFMEKHHLIPMEFYFEFDRSIDHQCNVVALCPTCHRRIHLGLDGDKSEILSSLLPARIEDLKMYYSVSEKQLLSYYGL